MSSDSQSPFRESIIRGKERVHVLEELLREAKEAPQIGETRALTSKEAKEILKTPEKTIDVTPKPSLQD